MRKVNRSFSHSYYRRRRQLTFRIAAVLTTICISGFFGVLRFGFFSDAREEGSPVSYKYFTSILIYPGDTLTSISLRYADRHYDTLEDYMDEVRRMNHLHEDEIRAGEYLVVPYYSSHFQ